MIKLSSASLVLESNKYLIRSNIENILIFCFAYLNLGFAAVSWLFTNVMERIMANRKLKKGKKEPGSTISVAILILYMRKLKSYWNKVKQEESRRPNLLGFQEDHRKSKRQWQIKNMTQDCRIQKTKKLGSRTWTRLRASGRHFGREKGQATTRQNGLKRSERG